MVGSNEHAILAGGCFWGMQDLLRSFPGVFSTRVGYTFGVPVMNLALTDLIPGT
jgi:peptide-methionine (S)-S-oxide reductase